MSVPAYHLADALASTKVMLASGSLIPAGLSGGYLLKGCLVMSLYFACWFATGDAGDRDDRETLIASLIGANLSFVVARIMGSVLPFRLRPIHDPTSGFPQMPEMTEVLRGWSSFPSDHAAIFTALAVGLWFVSRRLGAATTLYVFVAVLVPRVVRGLHYPSDIAGGMAVGLAVALACNLSRLKPWAGRLVLGFKDSHPAAFYWLFFIFFFEMATLFDDSRRIAWFLCDLIKH